MSDIAGFGPSGLKNLEKLVLLVDNEQVRQILETGDLSGCERIQEVKKTLNELLDIVVASEWEDEEIYINELIGAAEIMMISIREEMLETGQEIKRAIAETKLHCEECKAELEKQLQDALNTLDQEFMEAAAALDQKYTDREFLNTMSIPSARLVCLKTRAQELEKDNRKKELETVLEQISDIEMLETEKANMAIQQRYYDDNESLKTSFSKRRRELIEKFRTSMKQIDSEFNDQIASLRASFAKLDARYSSYLEQ